MKRLQVEFKREDTRGFLIQVNTNSWKQMNHLFIIAGESFGGHYHKKKEELFYVTKGDVTIDIINDLGGKSIDLKKGDCVLVEPYDVHTVHAITDCEIIELLSESYSEEDTYV